MKRLINERIHEIDQCVRETQQTRASTNQYRQQTLKVISEDRLKQLLQLDDEHLKTLSYAQIKGAPPR